MSQISFVLKNKEGHFLAQFNDPAEKIWIGSGSQCQLSIPDSEIENIEIEITMIDGVCWVHVSQETVPAMIEKKPVRTAKIDKNTTIQFKEYLLEVVFKESEPLLDKTRIVDSLRDDKTLELEKTKIASGEVNFSLLKEEVFDKTRVVDADLTISAEESRRSTSSKGQPLHKEREEAILDEIRSNNKKLSESLNAFIKFLSEKINDSPESPFFRPGLVFFLVFLVVGFVWYSKSSPEAPSKVSKNTKVETTRVLNPSDFPQETNLDQKKSPVVSADTTKASIKTVSREQYVDSMSRLFNP
jgi:hypothetical protein